jgi:bifunctional non-homologous end joining protein LigD
MRTALTKGSFFYAEGSSDKEYELVLWFDGTDYTVEARWGRRGNLGAPGVKYRGPRETEARKAFDAEVATRIKKRYVGSVQDGDGVPQAAVDETHELSDHRPQLLNVVDPAEATMLRDDPKWFAQQKFDGHRRAIETRGSTVRSINRLGRYVGINETIAQALAFFPGEFLVDGELIGETFVAFDLLSLDELSFRTMPYSERLTALEQLGLPGITVCETARTAQEKHALHRKLRALNAEGVVYRRHDAPYAADRPASGGPCLKEKFWQSATLLVIGHNAKRSVEIAAYDDAGTLVSVGNVTIPPNLTVPQVGDRVEIRYLDYFIAGSITQPLYLGTRDDVAPGECRLSQLRRKAG